MRLSRRPEPFDSDDYIFELKIDGFRSLAYIENGQCDLVSRNGNTFRNFKDLALWIGENLRVESAVLDGEIACVDDSGRSVFSDLLFRRLRVCLHRLRPALPEWRRPTRAATSREKGAVETAAAP